MAKVPLFMLKVATPLVRTPTRVLMALVLVSTGALLPEPKLKVPCCTSSWAGSVIGLDEVLSIGVQFALVSVRVSALEPPLGANNRFDQITTPTSVFVLRPAEVLVQPAPMISFAVPPFVPP